MKKNMLFMSLLLSLGIIMPVTLSASEGVENYSSYVTGNWSSAVEKNYNGVSGMTTHYDTSLVYGYTLTIIDTTDGDTEFHGNYDVSGNGIIGDSTVATSVNHNMQGHVWTSSIKHSPNFNA